MNIISRGIRNAFRNNIRTFSIVLIVGLSIGLALAMLVARQAVEDKIQSVKSSIGNTVAISPAGARGFEGGGEPLTTAELSKVSSLANVSKVSETLSDRLTSSDTNLVSAIDPGTLGNRAGNNSGVGFNAPSPDSNLNRRSGNTGATGQQQVTRTFTPPVTITGTNDAETPASYGGDRVSFLSGKAIDATKDENTAVVGKSLAEKNNLSVGSTFQAYGNTITVAGIYDSGNTFSNNGLLMSLPTVQRLSGQAGDVTSATVTVNSIDNIDAVVANIKSTLGTSADVVSNQDAAKTAVEPLENVKSISLFSLLGAVVAGAVIILLTMVMIVRERRREIGVFKAIGASNVKVVFQFVTEAITLTVLGMVAGLIIAIFAAQPITKTLVNNSASSTQTTQQAAGGRAFRLQGPGRGIAGVSSTSVRNIKASVGLSTLGYGVGAAIAIAAIGSALPALFISKIRPAEVMRVE
jgi:putative ABC transport system permease protein